MSLAEAAGVLSADTTRDGMGAAPTPLVPPMDWGHCSIPRESLGLSVSPGAAPSKPGGLWVLPGQNGDAGSVARPRLAPAPQGWKTRWEGAGCRVGGPWEGAQTLFSFRKCLPSESVGRGAPAPAAGAACPRTSHGRAPRSGAGNLALLPKQPPGTSCCNRGDRLGVTCLALNA